MRRKVIQITEVEGPYGEAAIFAVCDDGTMWWRYFDTQWKFASNVPQRELTEDEVGDDADNVQ